MFTELHERIVTPVQATLRDAGFDMQIKRLEAAAFTTAARAGEHDMRFLPMIYSSADFLYFFVSQAIPSPNTVRRIDDSLGSENSSPIENIRNTTPNSAR